MQFKAALRKVTEISTALTFVAVLVLAGCGGGASTTYNSVTVTQLSGTNGDMSKYLGTWISACGIKYTPISLTSVRTDGVVNRFDLTAVSGASVQGTFTTTVHNSNTSCAGSGSQTVTQVSLQYASNVTVTTPEGQTAIFAGTGDRIDLSGTGVTATPYNFAFRSNFSKFQLILATSDFSVNNLIYTKQ